MVAESRSSRMRMSVLGSVCFALFVALVARLWFLQILNETEFDARAEDNTTDVIIEPAPRGRILDAKSRVLVDNRPSIVITLDKGEMLDVSRDERADMLLRLARELSATGRYTKVAQLENRYQSDQYGPFGVVPAVGDIGETLQVYLAEHRDDFPGVGTRVDIVRDYPYGSVAAHVLGYVGTVNEEELAFARSLDSDKPYLADDEIGKSGIELFYEDALRGTPGKKTVIVDKFNNVLEERDVEPAEAGSDVQLTIDIDLQKLAEDQLLRGLEKARTQDDKEDNDTGAKIVHTAPAGAIVILDPGDGTVRAMASYPTYDPDVFSGGGVSQATFEELTDEDNYLPLLNRALQGAYPPGSTFKPITAYAALDTGLIGERGILGIHSPYEDKGTYTLLGCTAGCEFINAGGTPLGFVDLPLALTLSSDVYFYNLAANFVALEGFDSESPQTAGRLFGYGQSTGITLPQESQGRVPDREWRAQLCIDFPDADYNCEWLTGETLNTSIGQGDMLATPLQIANAYAVLANGGTLFAPNVVQAILDPITGEQLRTFGPRVIRRIFYPELFETAINDGLAGVTTFDDPDDLKADGTAFMAFKLAGFPHDEWPVRGKTGTAERQSIGETTADIALFAAWGPADDPEYVASIVMEESGFGGNYAAPVIANIFKAIATDSVPPAYNRDELALQEAEKAAEARSALGEDEQAQGSS
jgi:penicillin-binding protein 2